MSDGHKSLEEIVWENETSTTLNNSFYFDGMLHTIALDMRTTKIHNYKLVILLYIIFSFNKKSISKLWAIWYHLIIVSYTIYYFINNLQMYSKIVNSNNTF